MGCRPGRLGGVFLGSDTQGSLGGRMPGWVMLGSPASMASEPALDPPVRHEQVDMIYAAAPDGSGGVYVGGQTQGSLGGPFAGGTYDAWLAHYDSAGSRAWIRQFGTASDESVGAAAADGSGVYSSAVALRQPRRTERGGRRRLARALRLYLHASHGLLHGQARLDRRLRADDLLQRHSERVLWQRLHRERRPVPGQKQGLWIHTTNGQLPTPIQNSFGYLCINTQGMFRFQPMISSGTAGQCTGQLAFDFNQWVLTQTQNPAIVSGSVIDLQAWYRDPPARRRKPDQCWQLPALPVIGTDRSRTADGFLLS